MVYSKSKLSKRYEKFNWQKAYMGIACFINKTVFWITVFVAFMSSLGIIISLFLFLSLLKRAKIFFPRFNEKDGQVERRSHSGLYKVENGRPRYVALFSEVENFKLSNGLVAMIYRINYSSLASQTTYLNQKTTIAFVMWSYSQ